MALDPRLASMELLTLAALRAKRHQTESPGQAVVLQIEYDAYEDEPTLVGARYVLYLPKKVPSAEAWYEATRRFREPPRPAPGARRLAWMAFEAVENWYEEQAEERLS